MRKPCGTRVCREWCEDQGVYEPSESVCFNCGFEGPMYDWQRENDADDEDY
jgi:hypothetical protein